MPVDLLKGGAPQRPDRSLHEIMAVLAMAGLREQRVELSVGEALLLDSELTRLTEIEWMYKELQT